MINPITERQKQLLEIIYQFIKDTGYPPTFEEMRTRLNVSSNQTVLDHLIGLEKAKLIKRSELSARGICIMPTGYQILGKPNLAGFVGMTSAGAPIEAVEIEGDWKEMPGGNLKRLQEDIFMLRVLGDSMINAGIDDGDVVLIQTKTEFVSGEVVLAYKDEEATIKRFISDDKPPYVYLKPENPKYPNILFTDTTELRGKVISVLKNNYWKQIK